MTFSIAPDDGNVSFAYGATDVTGSNGRAGATLNVGDKASGTYTITASSGTVSVSRTVTVGTAPSLSVSVSSSASSAAPGDTVTFTATVTENSNPASGQALTFGIIRYTGTSFDIEFIPVAGTASLSSTSATTDSNGQASTSLTIGSGASGSYAVSATLSGGQLDVTSVTVEGSSSPPPTDPNPDPPEPPPTDPNPDPPPEVIQIPQEQQAAPEGPTGNTDAPESSTGNTPGQQAAPEGPTGNTQGTPHSGTTNIPADTTGTQTPDTPEQQAPDLFIDAFEVNKDVLDAGESFTISADVKNQGEGSSSTATLTYYQYFEDKSVEKVGESEIASLAAGETTDVRMTLTAPETSGTHSYYACVSTHCTSIVKISVRSEIKELVISSGDNQTGTPNNDLPNPISVRVLGEDGIGVPRVLVIFRVVSGNARMRRAGGPKRWRGASAWTDSEGYAKAYVTPTGSEPIEIRASVDGLDPVVFTVNPEQVGGAPSAQFPQSHVTALLANYPNPFNPETWIPYRLAAAADVTLTIYDINGQVVRQLALGHQAAGMYQTRSRAAYWDGRNAFGEPVASGVYFYTLTAGNFTATRKMLILK
ncbi:MAG: T9SS type A sorting domain-containing protein [Candidatus Poribacteria bacterium]|nr:T9SS type A sorting domain-containing protein [Candidatus Poribacteria bacterium]